MALVEKVAAEAMISLKAPPAKIESDADWRRHARKARKAGDLDLMFVREAESPAEHEVPISRLRDDQWLAQTVERATTITRDGVGQERILRRLVRDNQWCGLQFPYVKGGEGDELFTVRQILRLAREQTPPKLSRVDLVLKLPWGADRSELVERIRPSLEQECPQLPGCRISVFRSPESFLDREMMFGKSDQSIRWHVTAGHVAVHEKSPRDTTTWTLRSDTD
ncbi:MAG: hypothetical protein Q8M16_21380, partial [Pirellulaceae bacterium]|nr:hypothetical protein [Pirellulaceae bacterium]